LVETSFFEEVSLLLGVVLEVVSEVLGTERDWFRGIEKAVVQVVQRVFEFARGLVALEDRSSSLWSSWVEGEVGHSHATMSDSLVAVQDCTD